VIPVPACHHRSPRYRRRPALPARRGNPPAGLRGLRRLRPVTAGGAAGRRAVTCPPRRARPGLLREDAGAGAVELVIVTPLLMLLVLGVIQFALAEQAQHVAQAAATQALAAARVQDGTAAAGQTQAGTVLSQLGGSLTGPAVTVTRTATQARVTVTGGVESLIPGVRLHVRATVTGPAEEWAGG
jgi:Flp pilus assembly protein TadG